MGPLIFFRGEGVCIDKILLESSRRRERRRRSKTIDEEIAFGKSNNSIIDLLKLNVWLSIKTTVFKGG